jgi:putative MATE family efflux protein
LSTQPRSITRQLFDLSAPVIGINVLNVLMLGVDSALCGRLPHPMSDHALEALGYALQVVFLLMVAMLGLIVGTIALVARAYGAGDQSRMQHVLIQSTQLTAVVGAFVGLAGAALAGPILSVLGASDEVLATGVAYLRPLMIGTPFFYLGLLYAGIFRGVGNTRVPFLCAIVANVVNAGLNYCLVLGHFGLPQLGVTGSAIGTDIAQTLNAGLLVYAMRSGSVANLHLPITMRPLDRGLARDLFRIGWPAALDMLVLNAGFLTALGMLGRIDQVTVAAHGLGMRVQSLAFVPGLGIAQATGAMVGQALGAKDVARAKQVFRSAVLLCMAIMTLLAFGIVIASYPLVHIFDVASGSSLESYSVQWMRLLGYAMLPTGLNVALMGLFQGSGATKTSLAMNFWGTMAVQVPLAIVFAFALDLGAYGVWLSFPVSIVAKCVFGIVAYRGGKWAVTGLTPRHPPATMAEA